MQELEKVKDDLSKNLPRGFNTEREFKQTMTVLNLKIIFTVLL